MATPLFPVPILVDQLNKITTNLTTTVDNINNPTPQYVQQIYFALLNDMGFSPDIVSYTPREFDGLSKTESALLQEAKPINNVYALTSYFFNNVQNCDIPFGIMDLMDPKPLRNRKFLCVMVNFWLHCNNHYNSTSMVRESIKKKSTDKKDIENRIHDLKRKIEDLRQNKAKEELKAKTVERDIGELDNELKRFFFNAEESKNSVKPIKAQLMQMEEDEKAFLKDIAVLEATERRLKRLMRTDELKQSLENELMRENEEFESKMQQQEAYQKRETQLQQQESGIRSSYETLQVISSTLNMIHGLSADVKTKEAALDSIRQSIAAKDERLMQVLKEAADLKGDMVSAKGKWTKKKSCMESELSDYKDKMDKIMQEMTEEDIVAHELESSIRKIREKIFAEESCLKEEIGKAKQLFQTSKTGVDFFVAKIQEQLDSINQASLRLDKFAI